MRVMCVGASITMGAEINGGYRLLLEKMLEGAGIPIQFVGRLDSNSEGMSSPYHEGYSGFRIEQVEEGVVGTSRPIAEGVRELQPDVVLILCGTNDVRQNYALNSAPQRLDHLIGVIQDAAPQVRVMVSSLPPDQHCDDAVRRLNAGFAQVVAMRSDRGEKVDFVDNYAALNVNTDMLPDLTHPNGVGYLKIARGWFQALAPRAPQVAFSLTSYGATQFIAHSCHGYKITMKRATQVTDLGIYCAGQTLSSPHAAGVFDEGGRELARVEIEPGTLPSGLFAFGKMEAPLCLEAGESYFFVSNSVGLPALRETGAIIDPLFFDNPRFYFDHNVGVEMSGQNGLELKHHDPEIHDNNSGLGYFGPNFRLAPL